jgi:hypothetical protein
MNRIKTLQRMAMGLLLGVALCSAVPVPLTPVVPSEAPATTSTPTTLTVEQVLSMDMRSFSETIGHRLTIKERLSFQVARRGLREAIRDNQLRGDAPVDLRQLMAEGEKGFQFGGFVLGLLLGLIGVLIAYVMKRDKGFIRSAWIGWGVWVAIVIAVVAAAAASA